jgi:hypothetical protein
MEADALRDEACAHASQHITHAAAGHAGMTRGVKLDR